MIFCVFCAVRISFSELCAFPTLRAEYFPEGGMGHIEQSTPSASHLQLLLPNLFRESFSVFSLVSICFGTVQISARNFVHTLRNHAKIQNSEAPA